MEDETSNSRIGYLHVSIGSATTGAHMSFDWPIGKLADPKQTADFIEFYGLVDFCLEETQKCVIKRSQMNARMKNI